MDLEIIARHIQLLSKLLSAEPLLEGFKETGKGIPAHAFTTGGGKVISLEEAKSITREQLISNYHPMGSFMIAPREKGRVVGEALSVYGMRGLRVVDASVFSVVPRGVLLQVFTRRQRRRVT
jgi:choline dehydrogenase-like flavoprotein